MSEKDRLHLAKKELGSESFVNTKTKEMKKTTILMEADLFFAAKEVALKRKKAGIEPNTITEMIRTALRKIVAKEMVNT